jgi:hypothetical protein
LEFQLNHGQAGLVRPLAAPVDLGGQVLHTLADVREHLMKLPEERHQWPAVQYIAGLILKAANGEAVGNITIAAG